MSNKVAICARVALPRCCLDPGIRSFLWDCPRVPDGFNLKSRLQRSSSSSALTLTIPALAISSRCSSRFARPAVSREKTKSGARLAASEGPVPPSSQKASSASSFLDLFSADADCLSTQRQRVGKADSLLAECLDTIRQRRVDAGDFYASSNATVEALGAEERRIVDSILKRTDTLAGQKHPETASKVHPFWRPWTRVETLEAQVARDFEEFARLVGAAEARRQRLLLRASLKKAAFQADVLKAPRNPREDHDPLPKPSCTNERFWSPERDVQAALKNSNIPITWKDLHVLGHFVGTNGLMLPRRLTFASRIQQRYAFKAVSTARRMGLLPYDRKPEHFLMPVMDPLQFLVDELTHRFRTAGDLRAEAMLRVMMERYPKLDYFRFLQTRALFETLKTRRSEEKVNDVGGNAETHAESEKNGTKRQGFTELLQRYRHEAARKASTSANAFSHHSPSRSR